MNVIVPYLITALVALIAFAIVMRISVLRHLLMGGIK